jgi:UDPglucose 6-dehydrogenase
VAVIGAGHVGLPTAAALASLGHLVTCAESDPERLRILQGGGVPIFEAQLEAALTSAREQGRLSFVGTSADAARGADYIFLCVPTPEHANGSADLSFLRQAAEEIGPSLPPGAVVVNKSTVPIGATHLVEQTIGRPDVTVVSNPEFLREGTAVHDSLHPGRIVVGADDQEVAARVGALFAATGAPLLVTDAATAETIKYASNAFLATKLSFMNAIAGLCDEVGADVRDVILGLGYDHRIGFDFLRPGPGWGGSCFPKDTKALLHIAENANYDFPLLRAVIQTNEMQMRRVVDRLEAAFNGSAESSGSSQSALVAKTIGVWGLTFKAETDDLRMSPAIRIIGDMLNRGARVQAYDPTMCPSDGPSSSRRADDLREAFRSEGISEYQSETFDLRPSPLLACDGASALVVLTEWKEFCSVPLADIRLALTRPLIVDTRNLLDPAAIKNAGFDYIGVGRH